MGNRWKTVVPGALVLAGAASGICWSVTPASADAATVAVECSTYRSADAKWVGVSCNSGRYYVVGTACNERGCSTIGGPVVSAPATSWAYAGSGYFSGPISAHFV